MKLKSISLLLLLPTLMLFAGCSNSELTPAATPNLDVTVQARVAIALTAIPTATARVVVKEIPVEKIVKMVVTAAPLPTYTPALVEVVEVEKIVKVVVTAAPLPTYTPALVEVVEVEKIVKVVVTATPTPMPTATATPTPTTTPTPSPTPLPGTVIGSASPGTMLYNDTTWTLSGSPYRIQGRLQVPENVTLTIEPGVTVIGEGGSITFYGVIKAEGTESSKVYFTGGGVSFVGKGGNESKLIIRHGELKDIDGLITNYLTFELYDSLLVDVSIGGGANTYLVPFTAERNTFINTGQIYFRSYATPTIRYNCFFGKPPMFTHNVFMGGSAQINYNSIYGVSPGTFRHTLRSGTGSIDATQNYWHGLAESDVRALIYDKTVDLGLGTSVDILPMLYEPHPDTPDCSRVNE